MMEDFFIGVNCYISAFIPLKIKNFQTKNSKIFVDLIIVLQNVLFILK